MRAFLFMVMQFAGGRWVPDRRLTELPSDACTRWGLIATIACPELIQGDIRGACASCSQIVSAVQRECYTAFPGHLCTGDCTVIPTDIESCDSTACQECWSTQTDDSCTGCPSVFFTHSHCFDDATQTFSTPVSTPRESIIEDCVGMKHVYQGNLCCSNNSALRNGTMYIRI